MPISTDLNIPPYYDDFDVAKQYHRILFKPSYALQARELTQLQSILQDQLEQFGNNIFQEGSIVKGCSFTELNNLQFVKVVDKIGFSPVSYVGEIKDNVEYSYELVGVGSTLKAAVIAASTGFETKPPDLNTFYINYLNSTSVDKVFRQGETLNINRIRTKGGAVLTPEAGDTPVATITVTNQSNATGNSFAIKAASGVVFQKGNFLFAAEQLVILSKYSNVPDGVSIGYRIDESIVTALSDISLYDNAVNAPNVNAPGADRLKLTPTLVSLPTTVADADTKFFTLARYSNGAAVQVRDVSQYNVLGQEMARRTYEQSGDYITDSFKITTVDRGNDLFAAVGAGTAYVKGYRVENRNTSYLPIDQISTANTEIQVNQPTTFEYGGYVDIQSIHGNIILGASANNIVDLYSANTIVGTAIVDNITPDKMFIFNINMTSPNKFSSVEKVEGSSGHIYINNTIRNKSNSELVFDTGMSNLKTVSNIALPIRTSGSTTISSDTILIVADTGRDFDVDNSDIIVVDAANKNLSIDSIDVSTDKTQLTINLDSGQSPSSPCTIYYNIRIKNATPYNKLAKNVYLKTTFNSAVAKYNLDFPDVFEIVSITDSANTDVTDSFRLNSNQKDTYYDHSYIELKPGSPMPANGVMTINLNVFKVSGTGGFFNINSYPVGLDLNKIPTYTTTSNKRYNLRNSFDFRPYVALTTAADYTASTEVSAPVISPAIPLEPTFTSDTYLIPAFNTSANADYEYYLKRIDTIVIDSFSNFTIVKGEESIHPKAPAISKGLIIGQIAIPGYPALSPAAASMANSPEYAVKVTNAGTKAYTMKDIDNINKTVEDLRYYVVLSELEASTKNLNILDSNGLSRFKNGIIVDPFNDMSIADPTNLEYNASMDFTEKSLSPAVKTFPLSLKQSASSSASLFPTSNKPTVATLQRTTNEVIISQQYATNYRNCVSNFYNYFGTGLISPSYDASHDTITNPVNVNIDVTTPVQQFAKALQEFIPLTRTSSEVSGPATSTRTTSGRTTTTITTTPVIDTVTALQVKDTTENQFVGNFVTNVDFKPYMRANDIKLYMSGLKPNTRHYIYFDGINVDAYTAPGTKTADTPVDIQFDGAYGDTLITDDNGILRAIFTIPESTFFVGSRNIEIADVDIYDDIDSASISRGFVTYNAYNYSLDKSALTISTKIPQSSVITTTTNNSVVSRTVSTRRRRGGLFGFLGAVGLMLSIDPLAQTFFIKSSMTNGANCLFVSKIDLYFKRKSTTNGVTVMLREVVNGYPSYNIIPFSQIHLTPDQVNVPVGDDAESSIATTVTFNAPIRLNAETEYAVVIMPDAADPNYLIYTSKVGGNDFISKEPITQDWGDGVLFTSTNNRAWQSYQDEDIKFTLYRHDFTSSTGSVTLTNNDNEFLTIANSVNNFNNGEMVYSKVAISTGNVTITKGSNNIAGTSIDADYDVGDYILVEDGANSTKSIFRVAAKVDANNLTADRPSLFDSTTQPAYRIVVGKITYYDFKNPTSMILEGSSAKSGSIFTNTAPYNIIHGFTSEATAEIASVDNIELSYMQPLINKTIDNSCTVSMKGTFTNPSDTNTSYSMNVPFDDKTLFNTKGVVIFSKSNDLAGAKPFNIQINMGSAVSTTTPFIDIEDASILAYQYVVNDNSAKTSKYISKIVELAEDFDAEDFTIYVTGYRPINSDIKVYLKVHNVSDPLAFEANDWILMSPTTNTYSSTNNINDFREIVYIVPDSAKTAGVITYTNTSGTYETFRKFAVKIELSVNLVDGRYPIGSAPRLLDFRGIALT